ncbi:MAG: sodium:proton antiporter [Gammaproteobacteria bacterium]
MRLEVYHILTAILSITALVGFINARYIKLPTTIAIMGGALLLALFLLIVGQFGYAEFEQNLANALIRLDFHDILMQGMLSFLLFAGALTIDINYLRACKWEILVLATLSTLTSTFIVGAGAYYLLNFVFNITIPFIHCLLFGALISPTDPIAVLAIFKEIAAPKKLEVIVAGESLFNDGVAIVLFLTIYQVAFGTGDNPSHWYNVVQLFTQQALGGITYGALLGYLGYYLIKQIDDYKVDVLITVAMVTGGYYIAELLEISGPLAMVVAGIMLGNHGKLFSIPRKTQVELDNFWELVDEILNALLFFLLGLEFLVIMPTQWQLLAGIMTIPLVLIIRFITVGMPMWWFKNFKKYPPHVIKILTWGGLRGGLAVALALALPRSEYRGLILTMTYCVVIFAILVQGLSIKRLAIASKQH